MPPTRSKSTRTLGKHNLSSISAEGYHVSTALIFCDSSDAVCCARKSDTSLHGDTEITNAHRAIGRMSRRACLPYSLPGVSESGSIMTFLPAKHERYSDFQLLAPLGAVVAAAFG